MMQSRYSKKDIDVLIVDDRVDGLMALEAALDLPNINLVKAQSGREALDLLGSYDFAVILLDVQMPDMDGFETAEQIRKHESYKLTPIIFVTAINKDDRYVYKGYQLGAVDYLFKPFDVQVLKSKVSVFIDLHIKTRELEKQSEIIKENERRERYRKLAELENKNLQRYKQLADSIPHIVWKARADGIFDYFNKVWEEYTGLTCEQSTGLGWQTTIEPMDLNLLLKQLIHSMNNGESFNLECRLRRHDGEYRWHWLQACPELETGKVVGWIGTCTDIHDRKLTENKLIEAEQLAVAASIAKTSFLANMSHEIRTPMNAILGFSELMLEPDQTKEEREHCISTIHKCGKQLLYLIDEILDISKIEAGRLIVEKIEFNLVNLLNDTHNVMKINAENKNLSLDFKLLSQIPEYIYSDPTRIRQILVNIIGNAIKFTKEGSITVEIGWKATAQRQGVLEIYISDTGIGIDPKFKEKLFKPFVQVDDSTTRKYGGTGLGLFLSRKLAAALGGELNLEDKSRASGATFSVRLKVETPKEVSKTGMFRGDLNKDGHDSAEKTYTKLNNQLNGLKILLVEDSVDNQDVITYFLTNAGAHVDVADNGYEGIKKTLSGDYNVVLMDIQMPKLDGYQATSELRKKGYKGPIIALTAHALKEEREKCLQAGCTEHMTKPVNRMTLISQVAQFASKYKH